MTSSRLLSLLTGICLVSGCAGADLSSLQPAPGSGRVDLVGADDLVLEWRVPRPVAASVDGGLVRVIYIVSEDPARFALIAAPGGDGLLRPIQTRPFPFSADVLPTRMAIEHAVVTPAEIDSIRSLSERIARQGGVVLYDEQLEAIRSLRSRSTDSCALPFTRSPDGAPERYGYCMLGSVGEDGALEACAAPSDFRVLCETGNPNDPLPQVAVRIEPSQVVDPDIRPDEFDLDHSCYGTGIGCEDVAGVSDAELTMWTTFLQRAGLGASDLAAELRFVETVRWAKEVVSAFDVTEEASLVWARFIERPPPLDCPVGTDHPRIAAACMLERAVLGTLPSHVQEARLEIPRVRARLAAGAATGDEAFALLERLARLHGTSGSLLRTETCRVVDDVVDGYERRLRDPATARAEADTALAVLIEAHAIGCGTVAADRVVLDYCASVRAGAQIEADVPLDSVTVGSKPRFRSHGSNLACDEFGAVWKSDSTELLAFADSSVPEAIARDVGSVDVRARFGDSGEYRVRIRVVPPVDSVRLVTSKVPPLVGQDRLYRMGLTRQGIPIESQFCSVRSCPFPLVVYHEGVASPATVGVLTRIARIRRDTEVKAYLEGLPWTLRTERPWEIRQFDVTGPDSLTLPDSGRAQPDTARLLLRFAQGDIVASAAGLGAGGGFLSPALRWTIRRPDIASIQGKDTIVSVRPIAAGRTYLVAELTLRPDSILRDSLEIRVVAPVDQRVDSAIANAPVPLGDSIATTPAPGPARVAVGVGERCVVTLPPAPADSIPIVWTSSDSTVATAVADTLVGIGPGSALLTLGVDSSVTSVEALVGGLPPAPAAPAQPCRIR